jgi:hypothetical protein
MERYGMENTITVKLFRSIKEMNPQIFSCQIVKYEKTNKIW